jgi:hypothetical protein
MARADEVLAELRQRAARREPLTFIRPSRSGNKKRPHVMLFDPLTLTPVEPEHPCSCAAGTDTPSRYCWAVLEWLRDEAPRLSQNTAVLDRARMAAGVLEERASKRGKRSKSTPTTTEEYAF